MFDTNMVITVDKDVSVDSKPIRGVDPADPRIPQLKALAIGDSFFVEGAKGKDARPLVTLAKKIGVILLAREVKLDEIYLKPGVRIWRIEDPKNPQPATPADQPEQVTSEVELDLSTVRYWHHPESESIGIAQPGEALPDDPLVELIDAEAYRILEAAYAPETPAAADEDDDL